MRLGFLTVKEAVMIEGTNKVTWIYIYCLKRDWK